MKRSVEVSLVSYHLSASVLRDGRKVCMVILAHVVVDVVVGDDDDCFYYFQK